MRPSCWCAISITQQRCARCNTVFRVTQCCQNLFSDKQLRIGSVTLCFKGVRNAQRRKCFTFDNHDVSYKGYRSVI